MTTINQITYRHINRLESIPLTELLLELLCVEARKYELPLSGIHVPLNITMPDGGKDGEIKWGGKVDRSDWLPSKNICFQVKATGMGAEACKKEVLKEGKLELKNQVKKCFDEDGVYILFLGQDLSTEKIDNRIKKIREGIEIAGEPYYTSARILIYDSNKLALWANQHPSIVSFICEQIGLPQTVPLKTFTEWKRTQKVLFANNYVVSERLQNYCTQIKNIAKLNGQILRITGLSGLGKSRMIFQAFEMDNGPELERKMLQSSVLYYDASSVSSNFIDYISNLSRRDAKCNLIVDNCSLKIHNRLKKELNDSSFNLITTDSDPNAQNNYSTTETQIILSPEDFTEVIPKILTDPIYTELGTLNIERITAFAQGFPLIAVLLARQLSEGDNSIGRLSEEDILDRLLDIKNEDTATRYILRAVSLFDHIGFYDEFVVQRNFIATNKLLTPLTINDEIVKNRFNEVCEKYIQKGIIEKKGRKILLKPKPLALQLAKEWWESSQEDRLIEVWDSVIENDLAIQFCNQLTKLDYVPKVKRFVEKLCEVNGPFSQLKMINNWQESNLFCYLVEVSPQATVNCLDRIFSSYTLTDFRKIDKGRGNLTRTLSKLCFRKETFDQAARILLAFAASESKISGNNPKARFLQLFQVILPGTEVSLQKRVKIIEFALSKKEEEYHILALSAIEQGFKAMNSRMSGPEIQGSSKVLLDYYPVEIFEKEEYWRSLLSLLLNRDPAIENYEDKVKDILSRAIYGLARYNAISVILPEIKNLIENKGNNWPKTRYSLKRILRSKEIKLKTNEESEVQDLIEKLEPVELEPLYIKYISQPTWEDVDKNAVSYYETIRDQAKAFAKRFLKETKNLQNHFPLFYKGDQQEGELFGEIISQEIKDENRQRQFVLNSLEYFQKQDVKELNWAVFIGFLKSCLNSIVHDTLDQLETDDRLFNLYFYLSRTIDFDYDRILSLFLFIEKHDELKITFFKELQFNPSLKKLVSKDFAKLFAKLTNYGIDGIWAALYLLESYCNNDSNKWNDLKAETRNILIHKKILGVDQVEINIDAHSWECFISKILEECDNEFAKYIAAEIVEFCNASEFDFRNEGHIKNVLTILLEKYFDQVWPIFGQEILSEQNIIFNRFCDLTRSHLGFKEGLLFQKCDHDKIFDWVVFNQSFAPKRIAYLMPTLNIEEGVWHPFAKRFIDKFGNDEEVLKEINWNLVTFSCSSPIPIYEGKKKAFGELLDHPEDKVRVWAKNQFEYCERVIKQEKIEDEERYL